MGRSPAKSLSQPRGQRLEVGGVVERVQDVNRSTLENAFPLAQDVGGGGMHVPREQRFYFVSDHWLAAVALELDRCIEVEPRQA